MCPQWLLAFQQVPALFIASPEQIRQAVGALPLQKPNATLRIFKAIRGSPSRVTLTGGQSG